jgi:hypothetical protein
MNVYRIRRKSDGLFCQGGEYCPFGKIGKIWTAAGLKRHLGFGPDEEKPQAKPSKYVEVWESPHADCEIVEYTMAETGTSPLTKWYAEAYRDWEKRMAKEDKRIAAEQMRVFGETF